MKFVVCGEALIDLVAQADPPDTHRSGWDALSSGGPMNSAVALARLGEPVQFLGRLGSDLFAVQLRSHLLATGVGLDLAVGAEAATSLAVVWLHDGGKASYTFHFAGTANFGWQAAELPELGPDDWLHVASLALVVEPGASVLLEWVRSQGARVGGLSIDLNVRPSVVDDPARYWAAIEPWLQVVGAAGGVIKASDDDIEFLTRATGGGGAVEEAARWAASYPEALVVVTLGPDGAASVDQQGAVLREPGIPVEVVDTVGAGDTFMAGFLQAYVTTPADVAAALHRGVAAAAIVCRRRGANPPTAAEVDSFG